MNIVYIFSDQQHKYALGKVNRDYITPNLDALADDGIFFRNAYSCNPVCGPYRGCLMTGQYPSHCGLMDNADPLPYDRQNMMEMLHDAGYCTSYVGKWHLGGMGNIAVEPKDRKGLDYFNGYQCYNGFDVEPPFNNEVVFFDENGKKTQYHEHRTVTTTKLALQMLHKVAQGEKPFFLGVSYQAPHYPEQPLQKYKDLYRDREFTLPPDYIPTDPYTATQSPPSPKPVQNCPDWQNYGENMQKYLQFYAALCTQVDEGVGQIVQALKDLGIYEDTLIVYTSDHGDMQGSRGLKNKCFPYERSAGVPMIIRYPGGRRGQISDELITTVDIFPTLMQVAGGTTTTRLDGVDVTEYLSGKKDTTRDYALSEHCLFQRWRMIRDRQYKLITEVDYTPRELYDMTADPFEQSNLLEGTYDRERVEQMLTVLRSHTGPMGESRSGDTGNS